MNLRILNATARRFDQRLRDWITSFNSVGLEISDGEVMLVHLNDEVTDYINGVGSGAGSGEILDCGDRMTGGAIHNMGARV